MEKWKIRVEFGKEKIENLILDHICLPGCKTMKMPFPSVTSMRLSASTHNGSLLRIQADGVVLRIGPGRWMEFQSRNKPIFLLWFAKNQIVIWIRRQ